MSRKIGYQPLHNLWKDFGVVPDLKRHNAFIPPWRIGDDVGEVAIQGKQNRIKFLGLRDNEMVRGIWWNVALSRRTSWPASRSI
ncbi:MAG: hypothetical protein IH860_02030 [Chloroflexi bacterium]|nr:hypothetical protein [Chloroflexota bacterium]